MKKRRFAWVDAFTTRALAGNPCAVVLDGGGLTARRMLAIAREMGLSETAFVVPSRRADFGARYFTPESEIPLAGHPTIATVHALREAGRIAASVREIALELPAGVIRVALTPVRGGAEIGMVQLKPRYLKTHDPAEVYPLFGLTPRDGLPGAAPQTVSTGTPQLMVPVGGHAALRRARLDAEPYKRFRAREGFFSPHLFCLRGATAAGRTFARHLGVPPDTGEDPFTGSATGGMAAYLWRHGLIKERSFVAEQGHWMGRPGSARVELMLSGGELAAVKVAGRAVTLITGALAL